MIWNEGCTISSSKNKYRAVWRGDINTMQQQQPHLNDVGFLQLILSIIAEIAGKMQSHQETSWNMSERWQPPRLGCGFILPVCRFYGTKPNIVLPLASPKGWNLLPSKSCHELPSTRFLVSTCDIRYRNKCHSDRVGQKWVNYGWLGSEMISDLLKQESLPCFKPSVFVFVCVFIHVISLFL